MRSHATVGTQDHALRMADRIAALAPAQIAAHLPALTDTVIALETATPGIEAAFYQALLARLRFVRREGVERLAVLAEHFVNPLMVWALDADRIALADFLMVTSYVEFVQADERESHFAREVAKWSAPWSDAAQRHAARHPVALAPFGPVAGTGRYRVAFLLSTGQRLAHTEVLIAVLKGYRRQAFQPFDPVVIVMLGAPDAWAMELEVDGISVVRLDLHCSDHRLVPLADTLRQMLSVNQIVAAVQVSVVTHLPYLFGLPLAPVQLWWAMKYHAFAHPKIDGYLTAGVSAGRFAEIGDRTWRVGRSVFKDLFDARLTAEAARLRAQLPKDAVVLATLAREEKLASRDYLDAVVRILKENPNAHFLWTGRTRDPAVAAVLAQPELDGRTHFIGWVDTRLYAQVLDVFLDTFPGACGLTLCQAMAAAKAVVFFDCHEARTAGIAGLIAPILEGRDGAAAEQADVTAIFQAVDSRSLFHLASSVDSYVEIAGRLIGDASLRRASGGAVQTFANRYLEDLPRAAESYARHIDEVVGEAAERFAD